MGVGNITTALLEQPFLVNEINLELGLSPLNGLSLVYASLMTCSSLWNGMWFTLHSIYLSLNFSYMRDAIKLPTLSTDRRTLYIIQMNNR